MERSGKAGWLVGGLFMGQSQSIRKQNNDRVPFMDRSDQLYSPACLLPDCGGLLTSQVIGCENDSNFIVPIKL